MKIVVFILVYLFATVTLAQNNIAHNRLYFSLTPECYFNKFNVANDNKQPNPIRTYNTFDYNMGISYQRMTSYHLTVDIGLLYGERKHNIELIRDLSNFDEDAVKHLSGYMYDQKINFSSHYLAPSIMLGYNKKLNKKWSASLKGGSALKFYLEEGYFRKFSTSVFYTTDDHLQDRIAPFMYYDAFFGEDKNNLSHHRQVLTSEVYFGVERQIHKGWIKNISAGVEANRSTMWNIASNYMLVTSVVKRTIPNNIDVSNDYYYDRNVSIGLRFGVGFWE